MVDRLREGPEPTSSDLEEGKLPGVDLDLGSDTRISGGNDMADYDEENLYGNDVLVETDDVLIPEEEEFDLEDELTEAEISDLEMRGDI